MKRAKLLVLQVLVAVVMVLVWHLVSATHLFGDPKTMRFFFSTPAEVGGRIVQWVTGGMIWYHLGITLLEAALAFVIGSVGGILIGFWFARRPLVNAVFDPYVKAANALPRVVLAPIFALWLGLGIWSKVALGVTLVFFIVRVLPGDPASVVLGEQASAASIEAMRQKLGLDQPMVFQYLDFLGGVVRGDWGRSYAFDTAVLPLVAERLGRSLLLAGSGLAVLVPLAVAAGVAAARREGGLFDRVLSVVGLAVGALPEFVTGVFLILVFGIWLGWLPIQALPPEGAGSLTVAAHLVLPVGCLVLLLFAYLFRMTRASMIEALASDYTRTAVLKGLPQRTVIRRHVLRNALLPTITVIGAQIGWLVGGLVVVETLFKYPGIGSLIHFAATNKDIPLLVGCSLAITFVFALGNLAADLLYAALNPRVRHGRNAH